eukprot:SAG11_NODE_16290_length_552_cov_0.584989_1_plen_92_part_10
MFSRITGKRLYIAPWRPLHRFFAALLQDVIEISNLSRQFLFRNADVGTAKSTAAAAGARAMNPHITIRAMTNRVSPKTENVFDSDFWESRDI